MAFHKIISYKGAWKNLQKGHQVELAELIDAIPDFIDRYYSVKNNSSPRRAREVWENVLGFRGWESVGRPLFSDSGQKIFLRNIGPVKNKVSASISFGHIDLLNRWLFEQTTLAVKHQISDIPILIVPTDEFAEKKETTFFSRISFEGCLRQILPLTPLSHSYPFLILGYSESQILFEPEILELEHDPLVNNSNIVIDRCIEFHSEYYQAGLNILNFFGSYLREQYPDENAKVKIEQNDKLVRLIIETHDGEKEIVEKALEEYQLIVTGQKKPEDITTNQKLILELNSELRIAKYRIETQQDIIQVQRGEINNLLQLIGIGLANKAPVNIDFKPIISLTNHNVVNNEISDVLSSIDEIKQFVPSGSPEYFELRELEGSLASIEKENDPRIVKDSSAMNKFKKWLDKISNGNDAVRKAIETTGDGIELLQDLAGKYNKIAEWCGLPQVPSIFLKAR